MTDSTARTPRPAMSETDRPMPETTPTTSRLGAYVVVGVFFGMLILLLTVETLRH